MRRSKTSLLKLSNVKSSAEAAQVEMVELLGVSAVDSLGIAGVKESGRYHRSLGHQLSSEADVPPLPDILTEASEGDAGLTNPVVDFSIDVHHSRGCNNYNNNNLITYIVQVFIKMIKCASH